MKNQRKLLKWIALLLCLLPSVQAEADDVETTVFYAIPKGVVGSYSVKINIQIGSSEWSGLMPMEKVAGKTYCGGDVYKYTFTTKYGGIDKLQFQLRNGESFISQQEPINSYTLIDVYNGKMYRYNIGGWIDPVYDGTKSITYHVKAVDTWNPTKVYEYRGDSFNPGWPGEDTTPNVLNSGWFDYTVTGLYQYIVFNNGGTGDSDKTGNIEIGNASEYWVVDGASSTTASDVAPSYPDTWYIRDLGASFEYDVHDWATYVSDVDLTLPANVNAYTVSGVSSGVVTVTSVGYIPANVPVLLQYSTGSDYGTIASTKAEAYSGVTGSYTSKLVGSATTTSSTTANADYILYNNKFVLCEGTSVAKNRCYLPAAEVGSSARELTIVVDNGETGIETVKREAMTDNRYYDLQGRSVAHPTRGLYIVNGKKIMVK